MRSKICIELLLGFAVLGACSDDPIGPSVEGTIGSTGGSVQAAGGAVTVTFPAGAVSNSVRVTVRPNPNAPQDPRLVAGTAYEFGPDGTSFAQPVQLSIRYSEASIPAGASEASLVIQKAVGTGWQMISGGSVNAAQNTVTAPINSFSTYAILAVPVSDVAISPDSARVVAGDTLRLSAVLRSAAGEILTGRDVTWTSSDTSIATVSSSGLARGTGVGRVVVVATREQKSDTARLTISPRAALSLAVGAQHSCALDEAGRAYCWGGNSSGQLGDGTNTDSQLPVAVSGGLRFTSISAAGANTCALSAQGGAYCWGANSEGALGNGSTVESNTPVGVSGNLRFSAISVGGLGYACGLTTAGSAYCWGSNSNGQLGTGDTRSSATPVAVSGGLTLRSIGAGLAHTCGVSAGGESYCWGWNAFRQLDGVRTERSVPIAIRIGADLAFTSLVAGNTLTCGIAGSASYCWGADFFGSKGAGVTDSSTDMRTQVVGGFSFTSVRPSKENLLLAPNCGVTSQGAAYCWGANYTRQLGTASSLSTCSLSGVEFGCTGTPVPVAGGLTFEAVIPAGEHACGITRDGRVFCWGDNKFGQLGDGTTVQRNTPVAVAGGIRFP